MPIAAIIAALQEAIKYGPEVYAAAQRVATLVKNSGHPTLTADDIAQLEAFGAKTSADYLAEAQSNAADAAAAAKLP